MDEKDFELLEVLDETRNITHAADKLYMTQSALSKRIKSMEQELGVEILLRSRQGIRFTPAGEKVLEHSRAALKQMEQLRRGLDAMQGEVCGTLKAGVSVNFSYYRLPEVLTEYHKKYPRVRLDIATGHSRHLYQQMLDGTLDIAVLRGEYPWDGTQFLLSQEDICLIYARERRVWHQQELLGAYGKPLVCFTMNIAGPVKESPLIRRGFARGRQLLERQFLRCGIKPLKIDLSKAVTGPEAFYVLDAEPLTIKKLTTLVEDASPLGRLFDMDVLRPDGKKVDREELHLEGRKCLICGGPAKVCSSRRVHPVAELQARTTAILTETMDTLDAATAARQAVRALLYEVTTTPKPGLVDRRNSGSHTDMDSFTFMSSAASLYPYFEACTRAGRKTADGPAPETFAALRPLGCEAEGEMLAATHGVNTHKGAIFSIGIVCAALGRLDRAVWADPARVLAEVSTMTAGLTAKDFAGVTAENAVTAGQKLYVQYGITGVRGQVEAGLPAVLEFGLPALEKGLAAGYSLNQSGCGALLAIIANSTDTNLIARSDRATQLAVVEELKALLARTPYPDEAALRALDDRFIAANLSPGGSADLLALCYLLHFFKTEVLEDV